MIGSLLESPLLRALLLGVLVLLLQIPAAMIGDLVRARQQAGHDAAHQVAQQWGGRQEIIGPFLVVPYDVPGKDDKGKPIVVEQGKLVLAADVLDASLDAGVETRERGLFRIPVYRATATLKGRFRTPATLAAALERRAVPRWHEAELAIRVADVHAMDSVSALRWEGAEFALEPGAGQFGGRGLHAALPSLAPDKAADFELTLALRGSSGLYVAPAGLDTRVRMGSGWPDPAFQGAWLPTERTVSASGFEARWSVPYVARGLPAGWKHYEVEAEALAATLFGADFLTLVDPYRMTERSLKYWPLFIGLVFMLVWLFEVVGGVRVHAIQYLMVGMALCLFYLLELSLAEHFGFGAAYLAASIAVTLQVTLYSRSALGGRRSLAIFVATSALYGLLFLLLREDDYALLVGSLALFMVLSAVMFLTRHVQWGTDSKSNARAAP